MPNLKSDPVYTIGIAARLLGISVPLLRTYEKEGLILSVRTDTQRRLYSDIEIEKVKCIRRMISENGMNYEGIRRMLALVPCWRLRNCDHGEQDRCAAFHNSSRPCWATDEKCANPLPSCRDCVVYQKTIDCDDVKKLIYG